MSVDWLLIRVSVSLDCDKRATKESHGQLQQSCFLSHFIEDVQHCKMSPHCVPWIFTVPTGQKTFWVVLSTSLWHQHHDQSQGIETCHSRCFLASCSLTGGLHSPAYSCCVWILSVHVWRYILNSIWCQNPQRMSPNDFLPHVLSLWTKIWSGHVHIYFQ